MWETAGIKRWYEEVVLGEWLANPEGPDHYALDNVGYSKHPTLHEVHRFQTGDH